MCLFACALCACDLHDKIVTAVSVAPTVRSESSIDEYIQPADGKDYIQYADKDDYVLPHQPVTRTSSVVKKYEPKSVENDIKPKAEPEIVSPTAEAEPTPAPIIARQESEPDDVLLVPVKVAKKESKPVIVPPKSDEIIVEKGDTLYSLAKKYDVPLRDLVDANNIRAPYAISVGQHLKLPSARIHTVATGETLYSISRAYSVDLNSLATENNIRAPYSLSVGQKLRLPAQVRVLSVPKPVIAKASEKSSKTKTVTKTAKKVSVKPSPKLLESKQKISSSPTKPLPKIVAQKTMKFTWPVRGKILSGFGYKKNGLYNDGINIGAKTGTAVKASETGAVAYAGNELKGMGNLVIVQHANGWMSVYAHLDSMNVKRGTKIARGEKIGTVGKTGKVSESQLHFEIRKGTKAYNPRNKLK